jgi:hypothetical protein
MEVSYEDDVVEKRVGLFFRGVDDCQVEDFTLSMRKTDCVGGLLFAAWLFFHWTLIPIRRRLFLLAL